MSYSPTLGRWMQQDPAHYVEGASLYQLVSSNPVTFVDPFGLGKFVVNGGNGNRNPDNDGYEQDKKRNPNAHQEVVTDGKTPQTYEVQGGPKSGSFTVVVIDGTKITFYEVGSGENSIILRDKTGSIWIWIRGNGSAFGTITAMK